MGSLELTWTTFHSSPRLIALRFYGNKQWAANIFSNQFVQKPPFFPPSSKKTMPMGELFLSAFLQVLFDRLAHRELLQVARLWNVDAPLKKLTLTASKIKAVLQDAEEKQLKDSAVKMWLGELRDAVDDAEDVLDKFATEILRCKVEAESQRASTVPNYQVRHELASSFNPRAVVFNARIVSMIKETTKRLENISKQRVHLGLKENAAESRSFGRGQRLPTTSLVDQCFYGREHDVEKMIALLGKDDEPTDNGVCVIPLVGMAGVGKTTLARIVFNNKEVDGHFDLKAWAFVSDEFDVVKVTKAILESLGESCDYKNLEPLQKKLSEKLRGSKFLLVLDDVWNENYEEWDVLRLPFRAVSLGSKIIVTTRNENVAHMVRTVPICHLKELSDDDCWSVFRRHAFADFNHEEHRNWEIIGKEIVKKCRGLPLAVKTLGGLLRSKLDGDEWQDVLNCEVWDLPEQKCSILPALSLSYHHLPFHLKPCFAYCAMFPKGYEYEEEELVRLWIAEGFVREPQGNIQIEDEGRRYFRDLLSRSLFQRSDGNDSRFIMHGLINNLAQFVAGERCLRLEVSNQHKICEKARHVSFIRGRCDASIKFKPLVLESLRTFLSLDGHGFRISHLTNEVTTDLLPNLVHLRVLSLSQYHITELPDSIGNLKHLRYFDLSFTSIRTLPESLGTLYNLQTLILYGCRSLFQLPTNIGNLTNLRHLNISGTRLCQLPPKMGRLTNLRTLPYFIVGKNGGSGIKELGDMLHLRGKLSIQGLQNVNDDMDVIHANLKDKQYLDELVLEWSHNAGGLQNVTSVMILDILEPHRTLKKLTIKYYTGVRFSSWISRPSFSEVVFLMLSNCKKCTSLPPLGQLPSLKDLAIEGMDGVSSIGPDFYGDGCCSVKPFRSLETLKFDNMLVWKEWSSCRMEDGGFPCLRELNIKNCPELIQELPNLLPSLRTLEVHNCKKLTAFSRLPLLQKLVLEKCDEVMLRSVVDLSSLSQLRICQISNLRCLPEGFLQRPIALNDLEVVNCDELTTLSDHVILPHNTSLQRLTVTKCPLLSLQPEEEHGFPHILEYLEIGYCNNLKRLPHRLCSLTSLGKLKISNCPSLMTLPDIPSKLENLGIKGCRALQSLQEGLMCNKNLLLEYLEIEGCPSLVSFPVGELPTSLKQLKISDCLNLEFLPEGLMHKNTSLECLCIHGCSVTSFPRTQRGSSTSTSPYSISSSFLWLKVLDIWDCMKLESLPDHIHKFIYLDKLLISRCSSFVYFPEGGLPTNLTQLSISECENLKSLPNRIHNLTSLQKLSIYNCPRLESFPQGGLLTNLQSLHIIECNNLCSPSKWELYKIGSVKNFIITNQCP